MKDKKTAKGILLYVLSIITMACIYAPIIMAFFSKDVEEHNYEGTAMSMSELIGDAGVVAGILLLVTMLLMLRKLNHRPYLNVAKIFKFGLIPLYIYGVVLMLFSTILIIVPILGLMITASTWIGLSITGYILLLVGTIPQIMAILKAKREGVLPKLLANIMIIASFFFVGDVIALIVFMVISKVKMRKE